MRSFIVITVLVAVVLVTGHIIEQDANEKVREAFASLSSDRGLKTPVSYEGSTLVGSFGVAGTVFLCLFTSMIVWIAWKIVVAAFRFLGLTSHNEDGEEESR